MNKSKIGVFLAFTLLFALSSCNNKKTDNSRFVINEILISNEASFQDDYGVHSAWIEIFNKSFSSGNLAGYRLKVSSVAGDTIEYIIPKGDVTTKIPARQHALFWADGQKTRGTYHTSFVLSETSENWIGLYDSGNKLIDNVTIPQGILSVDQSYARVQDAAQEWEVKDGAENKYVTPSTNNHVQEGNLKMEKFQEHDSIGVGMAITAMLVVFSGLFLLFILFKSVGKIAVAKLGNKKPAPVPNFKKPKPEKPVGAMDKEDTGAIMAAITMALYEAHGVEHDEESFVLTISSKHTTSWSSKGGMLRDLPQKK